MDRVPLQRGVVDLGHSVLDTVDGDRVSLTTKERDLLAFLAAHPSEDVPRTTLLTEVWGYHPDVRTRALDTAVKGLRRKVENDPKAPDHILTVWGLGYRFEPLRPRVAPSEGFVGRAELLDALRGRSAPGSCTVLTGPAGVGKTRLAHEAVRGLPGACLVALDPVDDLQQVPAAVARALPPSDQALPERLARLQGPLVLDNAEHLGPGLVDLLEGWRRQVPSLVLWVTSRVALPLGKTLAVPPLPPATCEALVRDRLLRARPDQPPDPGEAKALAARLDGLPLAVELVCARAAVLGVPALLAGVEDLLAKAPAARLSSLDDAVARSLELLTDGERATLAACALWRSPFPADGLDVDALLGLLRASLLRRSPGDRLELLPTVRAAVRRLLPATVEQRDAHNDRVLDAAEGPDRFVDGRWIPDLLDRFADPTADARSVAQAGILLCRAARQWSEDVLDEEDAERIVRHAEAVDDPDLLAEAQQAAAGVRNRLGRATEAQMQAMVAAVQAASDPRLRAQGHGQHGSFLRLRGDIDAAFAAIEQGLEADVEHPLLWSELGLLRRVRGDLHGAREALERAVALAGPTSDPGTVAANLHRLGTTLVLLGRFDAAGVWLARAEGLCAAHGLVAAGHQIGTTRAFAALEAGTLTDPDVFDVTDPSLVSWFHLALNHGVRSLVALEAGDLVGAAEAAQRARAACGERQQGPAWAYVLLCDGIWRLFAHDPGSADALNACLACDDHATRVYADGYLAVLDPTHAPNAHDVPDDSLHGRFLQTALGPLGEAPSWGLHARLVHRLRVPTPEAGPGSAR